MLGQWIGLADLFNYTTYEYMQIIYKIPILYYFDQVFTSHVTTSCELNTWDMGHRSQTKIWAKTALKSQILPAHR